MQSKHINISTLSFSKDTTDINAMKPTFLYVYQRNLLSVILENW